MRQEVIPGKTCTQIKFEQEEKKIKKPSLLQKSSWAKLLARVFEIDISKYLRQLDLEFIDPTSPDMTKLLIKTLRMVSKISKKYPLVAKILKSDEIFEEMKEHLKAYISKIEDRRD